MILIDLIIFTIILFFISILGIAINRKNIILVLMSIELMLLSISIGLTAFSIYWDDIGGQIYVLFILTIAAAESAIALAVLVVHYRLWGTIAVDSLNLLKG